MPVDFPSSPVTGQSYTNRSKQWTWSGAEWYLSNSAIVGGLSGAAGATGTDTDTGGACVSFGMPGTWVRPPHSITTASVISTYTYWVPMWINSTTAIDQIAMRTVTVTTSGSMNIAIFNDHAVNPGRPGTIRLNAGSISYTTSSTTYAISVNHTLDRGWYWLGFYTSTGSSTWRGFSAYLESYWHPRMLSDPSNSSMLHSMSTYSPQFVDNPSATINGYDNPTVYLRIKA